MNTDIDPGLPPVDASRRLLCDVVQMDQAPPP
jgi:hypothetical protein